MLFNSFSFLVFAVLFFAAWPVARLRDRSRWITLIVASSVFYGWWDWRFLFLLYGTGLVDYFAADYMVKYSRFRKPLLAVSMGANLGTLACFKYLYFFTSNIDSALSSISGHHFPVLQLALPIGISFYTFQSMSYTIDVYRGHLEPAKSLAHFFASLSLFPHLVAGPIIRASSLLPQLTGWKRVSSEDRWIGLRYISAGFFKKAVIADNLAPFVNDAFALSDPYASGIYWWLVITLFAFQIYFDFSGYSDIAIGLARWMGYEFPINFNHPYISSSLREFWTRWHISLSTWFRDYLYVPIGGGKQGKWAGIRNMAITMLVSGFWHGAAWNFVIWGALHAMYLTLERLTDWPNRVMKLPLGRLMSTALVIVQVWIAWVFFRASSIHQATEIVRILFDWRTFSRSELVHLRQMQGMDLVLLCMILAIVWEMLAYLEAAKRSRHGKLDVQTFPVLEKLEPVFISIGLLASVYLRGPGSDFIYFQF